jgi:hypothetical protein
LSEIAQNIDISVKTLQLKFDKIHIKEELLHPAPEHGINLLIDATFFGKEYGFLCFHDGSKVIFLREIIDENNFDLKAGLHKLKSAGYRFKSVTIDGRIGYYSTIREVLGGVPIQMCLYHMMAIIKRHLKGQYRHDSAKNLNDLVNEIITIDVQEFIVKFYFLKNKYQAFLDQKTNDQKWKNPRIRRAYASMMRHMPQCFTFRELPEQNIPHTNNRIEGSFSHLKSRLLRHRGLSLKRRKNAIKFLINKAKYPPISSFMPLYAL